MVDENAVAVDAVSENGVADIVVAKNVCNTSINTVQSKQTIVLSYYS